MPSKDADSAAWAKLGPLLDGLAHADDAIRAAGLGLKRQYDLGPRGAWILSRIFGGVRLPTELAAAFRTSRSLMTIELNRVTKAGLVEAASSSTDGRSTEFRLTSLGVAACKQMRKETARLLHRNLTGYSAKEIELVIRVLADVRRVEPRDGELPKAVKPSKSKKTILPNHAEKQTYA